MCTVVCWDVLLWPRLTETSQLAAAAAAGAAPTQQGGAAKSPVAGVNIFFTSVFCGQQQQAPAEETSGWF